MTYQPLQETLTSANDTSESVLWAGGSGNYSAKGEYGGATAKLEYSQDNGATWTPVETEYHLTGVAAGGKDGSNFFLPMVCLLHIALDSASGTTNLVGRIE